MISLKKFNCLILSFLLIIGSVFVSTKTVSAEIIKIGVITGDGVRMRADATTDSEIVTKLNSGTTVTVLGSKAQVGGGSYTWYKVNYINSGQNYTGYVREDLISVSDYNTSPDFKEQLAAFPADYREALTVLHSIYPNWTFIADPVSYTFKQAVALEDDTDRKLIDGSYVSLRSLRPGCYDWNTDSWIGLSGGGWYGASTELIKYYMDPRNFLNANEIYYYLQQGFDVNSQNLQGINNIVKGSFLYANVNHTGDSYHGRSYSQLIWDAGVQSGVNPYFLASTILQEQGTNGATLSRGYSYNGTIVYNFFNWSANGSTSAEVNANGGKYAYSQGWTTPSASIIGGAMKYGDKYVKEGQDTYFYKNFNICNPDPTQIWKQYAQNVADGVSSARKLAKNYVNDKTTPLTFKIPVYKDNSLPATVCPYPIKSTKLYNNYYFKNIEVIKYSSSQDDITPRFDKFTYEYSLSVSGDTTLFIEKPGGTSLASPDTISLNEGDNVVVLSIKSQTGYTKDYTIYVNATNPCTLKITDTRPNTPQVTVKKGDTNGDGKITLIDLANVRLHLLELKKLSGNNLLGADTNGDNKVSLIDLANIRLHLLEIKLLG